MLSAGLDVRYVFASYELCDFREVALPLWLAHPNPACQPVPCWLLHPLPPHSFCTNHLDLPSSPTSRPLSLLFPLPGAPFLARPTLSSQCSPALFLFYFLSCCFAVCLPPFSGWELHLAPPPQTSHRGFGEPLPSCTRPSVSNCPD